MATITLSIPDKMREKMRSLDHVNWSAVARDAVIAQIKEIERKQAVRELLQKEQADLQWTVDLGRKLKKGRAAHFKKNGLLQ